MLKLTLRPGEFIDIGENVRVIFSGGSANNIHLLVDAPREINIARSSAAKKKDTTEPGAGRYYKESGISDEAQKEIVSILMREKRKNAARRTQAIHNNSGNMRVNLGACLLYKSKGTDFPEKTFLHTWR